LLVSVAFILNLVDINFKYHLPAILVAGKIMNLKRAENEMPDLLLKYPG